MGNWKNLDLNLLVVFDAVMQARSLTQAGKRLGLSQPAISHALARLRHALADELLVRGPNGMVPTARAEQLAGPVREMLAGLQAALEPRAVQPADMTGMFTVAVDGYTAFALTNQIVDALQAEAPRLGLTVVPSGTRNVLDELDAGAIDLALTRSVDGGDRFKCSRVLTDHYVAVMRSQHPAAAAEFTLESLASLRHLTLTSTGDSTKFLDEALNAAGLRRDAMLSLPFLATPDALAGSDLVAVLPARVAARLHQDGKLVARPLPCAVISIHLVMTWHRRRDAQPEHRWVRSTVRRCLAAIEQAS